MVGFLNSSILFQHPHLIEAFLFCKREFYLEVLGLYNQDEKTVAIGRAYHNDKTKNNNYPIKVDKIDWKKGLIIELKKKEISDSAILQTYLYLKKMQDYNQRITKAIITSIEKHKKIEISYPDEKYEQMLKDIFTEIEPMNSIPERKSKRLMCGRCSLFEYCWVD